MRLVVYCALVAAMAFAAPALAMDPADKTPLGVLEPLDNAEIAPGTPWAHYLGGFYYLHAWVPHDPTTTWVLAPLKLGKLDPIAATNPQLVPLPAGGRPGEWAKIRVATPGWVHVEVYQHGILVDEAEYCFYQVVILEDEVGGRLGFDPRYGGSDAQWFPEEGGYHFSDDRVENEPGSEDLLGWDDRYEPGALPTSPEWTGLGGSSTRAPRWRPEAALQPHPFIQLDSLMAVARNNQHVRVWVHGPREGVTMRIPIYLHCNSLGSGEVQPGRPPQGGIYEIQGLFFAPPQPAGQPWQPANGMWTWPAGVTQDPVPLPAIKTARLDDPPPTPNAIRNGRWIIRFPWKAKKDAYGAYAVSGSYADIEVEARIPNPMNVGQAYGADPTGTEEGVLNFRWGTVFELEKVRLRSGEPTDLDLLKDHWYRRVKYVLNNDNAIIDPDKVTIALGAKAVAGTEGRSTDLATISVKESSGAEADDRYSELCFKELTVSVVNRKLDTSQDSDFRFSHWTEAEWPADARGKWFDEAGQETRPASLTMLYRGFTGVTSRGPVPDDFDAEPREPRDKPPTGAPPGTTTTPITKEVLANFINVISDVDNDGDVDADDDDNELEDGLLGGYGVVAFPSTMPPTDHSPNSSMRRLHIMLSDGTPTSEDYEVRIESALSPSIVRFWEEDTRDTEIPYSNGVSAWKIPIPAGGVIDVWVESLTQDRTHDHLQFFLMHRSDESETATPLLVWRREALDEVKVTLAGIGIDVDSNNDGTISDKEDDPIEETEPGVLVDVANPIDTPAVFYQHPCLDAFDEPIVRLVKDGEGLVEVRDQDGSLVLGAEDTTYEFDLEDIGGDGELVYRIRGIDVGSVTLSVELEVGGDIVASDLVAGTVVAVELDYTDDVQWHDVDPEPPTSGLILTGLGDNLQVKGFYNGPYYTQDAKFKYKSYCPSGYSPWLKLSKGSDVYWDEALPFATTATWTNSTFTGKLPHDSIVPWETGIEASPFLPNGDYTATIYYVQNSNGQAVAKPLPVEKPFAVRRRAVLWANSNDLVFGSLGIVYGARLADAAGQPFTRDPDATAPWLLCDNVSANQSWLDAWGYSTRGGDFFSIDHGGTETVTGSPPRGTYGMIRLGDATRYGGWNASLFTAGNWEGAGGVPPALETPPLKLREFNARLYHCWTANYCQHTTPWMSVDASGLPQDDAAGQRLIDNMYTLVTTDGGDGNVEGALGLSVISFSVQAAWAATNPPFTQALGDAALAAAVNAELNGVNGVVPPAASGQVAQDFLTIDGLSALAMSARVEAAARAFITRSVVNGGLGMSASDAASFQVQVTVNAGIDPTVTFVWAR